MGIWVSTVGWAGVGSTLTALLLNLLPLLLLLGLLLAALGHLHICVYHI
jgi:hypothetical protein